MGNITNLATHGNYATEANGVKVSFNFVVDNKTSKITDITSGQVTKDEKVIAVFDKEHYGGAEDRNRIKFGLEKGYEIEAVTAAVNAITAFEAKIAKGEAL